MIKYLIIPLILVVSSTTLAQDEFNFEQYYSGNTTIKNLSKTSYDKVDSLYKEYINWFGIPDNESYRDFVFEYSFFMEELNKSGRVFYHNDLNDYLNGLKNEILRGNEFKNRIRVLTVNSSSLNAFTNDLGTIYVNVATIAKVKNETELLVILAHEIAHVLKRHSYQIEDLENRFNSRQFDGINKLDNFTRHNYSRMHELEADSMAYALLNSMGVDLHQASGVFDRLKNSENPVYGNAVELREGWGKSTANIEILEQLQRFSFGEDYTSELVSDTLTTHPSVEQRKEAFDAVLLAQEAVDGKASIRFSESQLMASILLLDSYLKDHEYSKGLYHAMQLRSRFPDNLHIEKNILKFLLLITQNNYEQGIEIINNYGSDCNDLAFMQYRYGLLHISPLEMNLLTYQTILDFLDKHPNNTYALKLKSFALQFLYKYNPDLFKSNVNGLEFNKGLKYKQYAYSFSPLHILTSNEYDRKRELEEEGFLLVNKRFVDSNYVQTFLQDFNDFEALNAARESYKKRRDIFESTLTLDQFMLNFTDEKESPYRKGTHIAFDQIDPNARIGLIQSDTYFFTYNKKTKKNELAFEKTMKWEQRINDLLFEEKLFDLYMTNRIGNEQSITIADNYDHHTLSAWIGETLTFKDLVYSASDEEISRQIAEDSLDYVVYNMNYISKEKNGYRNVFYDIYFDINSMGIAYVSCVTTTRKPRVNYLRHIYYQSLNGVKKKKKK